MKRYCNFLLVCSVVAWFFTNRFSMSLEWIPSLKVFGYFLPFFWFLSKRVGMVATAAWYMFWMVLHSPPLASYSLEREFYVAASNGCGLVADHVLVTDGQSLWREKSRALKGDTILVVKNKSGTSSYFRENPSVLAPEVSTSSFCRFSSWLREYLLGRFDSWPNAERTWLSSFVLGADLQIDGVTGKALRDLSLLHIVVLSGGHLAVIFAFFMTFFAIIPCVFYVFRSVSMSTWPHIWTTVLVFAFVLTSLFAFAAGLSQSIQRALLMFVLLTLSKLFFGGLTTWTRLSLVWVIQGVIFPIHFYSLSTFLTWTGSVILHVHSTSRFGQSIWFSLRQDIKIQLIFSVLTFFVFGRVGLVGIIANLILMPIFSLALIANLSLFIWTAESALAQWIVLAQMQILELVRRLSALQAEYSFLSIYCPDFLKWSEPAGQILATLFLGRLLFKIHRKNEFTATQ